MVEFVDGSVLAPNLAQRICALPIQYALTYPERVEAKEMHLDWERLKRLDFDKVSARRYHLFETGSRSGPPWRSFAGGIERRR